jgi:hypothetical protein
MVARLNQELTATTVLLNMHDRRVGVRATLPFGIAPMREDVLERTIRAALHTMELAMITIDKLVTDGSTPAEVIDACRDGIDRGKALLAAGEPVTWSTEKDDEPAG